jgi:hypothetical protein
MIDRAALLGDLKKQVGLLEDDLRQRSEDEPVFAAALHQEWQSAREAKRTASTYETWREERVTQSAAAWVLGTVFVRFCEDNGLVEQPYFAGPSESLAVAIERQQAFFEQHPERTDRDWIIAGTEALSVSKVTAGLFDQAHNPMWSITPSHDAAKVLLTFWRRRGENGKIVHDFVDGEWNTRFLGDLYQDLSEYAKKTYALLQTPEFVGEFILDYTLTPAIGEFGLDGLRLIDPTCGSGHFLLWAFARLLERWEQHAPGADRWELIARALSSVHGVDKNPFAAAIARYRLLVAAMKAAGVKHLADVPEFAINVAVGDSLLHGRGGPGIQAELDVFGDSHTHMYVTEDVEDYEKSVDILNVGTYHVVVGNPPYITVKDKQENDNYRTEYASCSGTYALSVPFAERFFKLARIAGSNRHGSGYVGQITANSFMKREFGKKLVEEYLARQVNLTHVIDTSGAYIPGHGTPTVILIGRRYFPNMEQTIRAVLGIRGEPHQPLVPADGMVWRAIVDQIDKPRSESEWISTVDLPRDRLKMHPWSLSGGGAAEMIETLERQSASRLMIRVDVIGRTTHTGLDEAFYLAATAAKTRHLDNSCTPVVLGEGIRDFTISVPTWTLFPYDQQGRARNLSLAEEQVFWPNRTVLQRRVDFGHRPEERGLRWFDHSMFFRSRFAAPLSIAFAFVATHNHFVLDRGGKVFNRSAPVIKLLNGASEDDHVALLGVLNSSTACFWLKQVSQNKGNGGIGGGIGDEAWEPRYEFTGTKLEQFPFPAELPLEFGRELTALGERLNVVTPAAVCANEVPTRGRLDAARAESESTRGQMIALQEELDWDVYRRYGLLGNGEAAALIADPGSIPDLKLGERAFEILLARRMAVGEVDTQWFTRHGSTPVIEIPPEWPHGYREVVARRIETIERRQDIALIERPECKRRWQSEPWEKKEQAALRTWLLDRCEDHALWYATDEWGREQPKPMTVNRLADRMRSDADMISVARLLAGTDADLADVLAEIIADEHVPYLSQLRYTDSGLRKRVQWEHTWDLQRQEDRDRTQLDIPVPPKYKKEDFLKTSYWNQRGKLDVSKERFVSYPLASPEGDDSLLLGWARWDHREQAHALMTLIDSRRAQDGWGADKMTPLIAGLAEVMPWVRQWHGETDPTYGTSPAKAYDTFLEDQRLAYGLAEEDLRCWPPPKVIRVRRRKTTPARAQGQPSLIGRG